MREPFHENSNPVTSCPEAAVGTETLDRDLPGQGVHAVARPPGNREERRPRGARRARATPKSPDTGKIPGRPFPMTAGLALRRLRFVLVLAPIVALAQVSPPPPPLTPLPPPPAPPGNPITPAKVNLGKVLFWDEQLSSSRTVACGTCHRAETGGSDPRSVSGLAGATAPGPDGTLGTADDITGSPGVVLTDAGGAYDEAAVFGLGVQVTTRHAPSFINAAYAPNLFWDGRARTTFLDPVTG